MVTAPRGRGEPSLSQTAGCKSSVVAMGDQRIVKRGNVETAEKMEVEKEKEKERKEGSEGKEELKIEEKIANAQQSENEEEKEKEKESKPAALSRTSIAIPLPAIMEVPATQESDRLFPR